MRMHGHGAHDDMSYVPDGMHEEWERRTRSSATSSRLGAEHGFSEDELASIREDCEREVAEAASGGHLRRRPTSIGSDACVRRCRSYSSATARRHGCPGRASGSARARKRRWPDGRDDLSVAICDGLREEMRRDERLLPRRGHRSLRRRFQGHRRVHRGVRRRPRPRHPAGGKHDHRAAVGAAIEGMRPVCERCSSPTSSPAGTTSSSTSQRSSTTARGSRCRSWSGCRRAAASQAGQFHSQNLEAWSIQSPA